MSHQRNWQPWPKSDGIHVANWPTDKGKQLHTFSLGLDIPQPLVGTPAAERLLATVENAIERLIAEDKQIAEQMQALNVDYAGVVVEKELA